MNIAELLRKLADTIDTNSQPDGDVGTPDPKLQNPAELIAIDTDSEEPCEACGQCPCACNSGEAEQPDDIYVPPLQLKLELLKKAAGVESVYDDEGREEEQGAVETYGAPPEPPREVDQMKRLAAVVRSEAADDDIIDD